ncbi:hypothetical protein [Actinoplanes sp. NPDC049265]|uniref:terpene synthase family protein n=1 Tax=Actinoplanes sp. NPDC049265 TaxID=3363902 RepID=UPI003717EEFF
MTTETLLVPCPFPDRSHPGGSAAAEYARAVGAEVGLTGVAGATVLNGIALGEAAALIHPDTDQDRLQVATLWTAFLVLFDDAWSDRLEFGGDWRRRVIEQHATVREILGGRAAHAGDDPLIRLLGRILADVERIDPGFDSSRLRAEIGHYLSATLWELDLRSRREIPDLATYMVMRRVFSTMTVQLELDYFVDRLRLDEQTRTHPIVRLVDGAVADYGCIANDLYSLAAERRAGIASNIVIVLEHEYGWDEPQAMAHARRMCERAVRIYQDVSSRAADFGLRPDEDLRRYLRHYESLMSAAARWPARSARYRSSGR